MTETTLCLNLKIASQSMSMRRFQEVWTPLPSEQCSQVLRKYFLQMLMRIGLHQWLWARELRRQTANKSLDRGELFTGTVWEATLQAFLRAMGSIQESPVQGITSSQLANPRPAIQKLHSEDLFLRGLTQMKDTQLSKPLPSRALEQISKSLSSDSSDLQTSTSLFQRDGQRSVHLQLGQSRQLTDLSSQMFRWTSLL